MPPPNRLVEQEGSDEDEIPLEESLVVIARQNKNPQVMTKTVDDLAVTPRLTPETEMQRCGFYTTTKLEKTLARPFQYKESGLICNRAELAQNKGQ